jgi:hypothetical protein
MPDGPRQIVANTPSPPLPLKSPESPLKKPPNKPKILCANSLDTQLPFLYIQATPKRVLINKNQPGVERAGDENSGANFFRNEVVACRGERGINQDFASIVKNIGNKGAKGAEK